MIIKTLNRSEAQNAMKEWVLNYPSLPEVEGDYLKIRKDIQEIICGVCRDLTLELQLMTIFGDIFR